MAVFVPALQRRWLSPTHILFIAGVIAGPMFLGLANIRVQDHAQTLQLASEICVLISLYAAGIKLRIPFHSKRWITPVTLATITMILTIIIAAAVGHLLLGLSLSGSILLGAVLAPTDPVLADKIQVEDVDDNDALRQSLTGEAGLNDGTAFPFVLLAVGLSDPTLHHLGDYYWEWFAVDFVWQIAGGLILGIAGGTIFGKWSWYRSPHQEHEGVDELLAIGFVAIIYGIALTVHTYGFLAVFAAAVCLRRTESMPPMDHPKADIHLFPHQDQQNNANAKNQETLLREQTAVASALERIAQAFLVVAVGIIVTSESFDDWRTWLFGLILLLMIRPFAVISTLHSPTINVYQRNLIAWFGIRGIGTIYYLSHSLCLGIAGPLDGQIAPIIECCIVTVALSIWLHGLSDTPLMDWYLTRKKLKP